MCWLRVKIKAKGSGVQGVKSWNLDHRTRSLLCAGYVSMRGYTSK